MLGLLAGPSLGRRSRTTGGTRPALHSRFVPSPNDTHPEAARVQLELLRKAGVHGRLGLTQRLSQAVRDASRRAIAKRHPELSKEERDLLFVELHYGKELARRLRAYLSERRRDGT